jgi:hypothetical protein
MTKQDAWVILDEVGFGVPAEILLGLLEAQGIHAILSQEGAGKVYSTTVGVLGRIQILVLSNQLEAARKILDAFYAGEYNEMGFPDEVKED